MSVAHTQSKVLVVEDEVLVRELLVDTLDEMGVLPLAAATAEEAFTLIAEHRETLVGLVTDINLGVGARGWDVARRARELNADLPVVYITGDSGHEWPVHGVPESKLLAKPFAPGQVTAALASLSTPNGSGD